MAQPYLSEIRIFSFGFAPRGWALCNGQTLPIQQNAPLFSLLGTTYGGDGRTNFMLPNLQGNVAVHVGNGHIRGEVAGEVAHTLNLNEIPQHIHTFSITAATASGGNPESASPGAADTKIGNVYAPGPGNAAMSPQAIALTGTSQPHNNLQPYLVLNACIALVGIFPSRG